MTWKNVKLFFLTAFVFAMFSFGAFVTFTPEIAMWIVGAIAGIVAVLPRE